MSIKLNHKIVHARDKRASATFLAEILELPAPTPFGHFLTVQLEALRRGIWGTQSLWGRVLTYKPQAP